MKRLEDQLDIETKQNLKNASPEFLHKIGELIQEIPSETTKKMNGQALELSGEAYFRMKPFLEHGFTDRDIMPVIYENTFGENPQISFEEFQVLYQKLKVKHPKYII